MLLTVVLIIATILIITFWKRFSTVWQAILGPVICIVDIIAVFILLCFNIFFYSANKTSFQERYAAIEKAIEEDRYDGYCADIAGRYNAQIKYAKKYRDNLWIGWFMDRAAAEQELIVLKEK